MGQKGSSFSNSYCPHYERDTCLIHFKCCPEERWYPCHKCHNEAVGLEPNDQALQGNGTEEHRAVLNDTAREMSDAAKERSFGKAQETSEHEGMQVQEDESTSDGVGENENPDSGLQVQYDESTGHGVDESENPDSGPNDEPTGHGVDESENPDSSLQVPDDESTGHGVDESENPDSCLQVPDDEPTGHGVEENEKPDSCLQVQDDESTGRGVREETLPAETETKHSFATALDGTRLQCTKCKHEQTEFSKMCESCHKKFAEYVCQKCKLVIEKKVDAYHCEYCGMCRGNKTDHFHCHGCNICISKSLKGNHKCYADRGHDPCAICYEEVFYGAIIFPCFHMVHKDCAEKLILSGSRICPTCRGEIFQNGEYLVATENTTQHPPYNNWSLINVSVGIAKGCLNGLRNKLYLIETG